jgi:hypothetical protein
LAGAFVVYKVNLDSHQAIRLVAIFLGLLKMNINQAIDAVVAVASVVFPQGSQEAINQIENSENLKAVVEGMLRAGYIHLDAKMYEPTRPPSTCKVLVHPMTSCS